MQSRYKNSLMTDWCLVYSSVTFVCTNVHAVQSLTFFTKVTIIAAIFLTTAEYDSFDVTCFVLIIYFMIYYKLRIS